MNRLKGVIGFSADRNSLLVRGLYGASLAVIFIVATCYLDGARGFGLHATLQNPWPLFLNALPGLCLAWLLVILSRRPVFSFWLAFSGYALLDRINAIKIANLQTPLLPQDAAFVKALNLSSIHLFGEYAGPLVWVILGVIAYVACTILLFRAERPIMRQGVLPRAMHVVGLVAFVVVVHWGFGGWRQLYDKDRIAFEPWAPLHTEQVSGMVNTFVVFSFADAAAHELPTPSPRAVERLLKRYATPLLAVSGSGTESRQVLPNIIVLQSESFFDPSVLKGFGDRGLLPHFKQWQSRGVGGWLHVPTFGGGTIRTEFEVLTGISLRALPHVNYPYLQLPTMKLPGLVRTLDQHGYYTESIHPNGAGFWNRGETFRELGFDRRTWIGGFHSPVQMDGPYASDKSLTDEILYRLRQPSHGKPKFIFAISIENHGPYQYQPNINVAVRNAIKVPADLPADTSLHLKSYLYHLHHVDVELNRLAKAVMAAHRPTILLFYGDHMPPLPDVYKSVGFRNGGNMLDKPVPWLLLDNREHVELASKTLAAWMLPGLLLRLAHIHDDGFFLLESMVPARLAGLTHSPWIKPTHPGPGDASLVKELASADVLRLKGKFAGLYAKFQDTHAAPPDQSVGAVSVALGRYVTSDYRVGGFSTHFAPDSPLFARIDLAGDAAEVKVGARISPRDGTGTLRQAASEVNVPGRDTLNLDLRGPTPLVPGPYILQVMVDGKVVRTLDFNIRAVTAKPSLATH